MKFSDLLLSFPSHVMFYHHVIFFALRLSATTVPSNEKMDPSLLLVTATALGAHGGFPVSSKLHK